MVHSPPSFYRVYSCVISHLIVGHQGFSLGAWGNQKKLFGSRKVFFGVLGLRVSWPQDDARIDFEAGIQPDPEEDSDPTLKTKARKSVKKDRPAGASLRGPLKGCSYVRKVEAEIHRLRSPGGPEFLVPRASFCNLVKEELTKQKADGIRISSEALKLLQWAAEGHVSEHLSRAAHVAGHGKRQTIMSKDFALVKYFQQELVK